MSANDKKKSDEKISKKEKEEELEEGLEDTFPASDPVSATQPGTTGFVDKDGKEKKNK